MNIGDRVRDKGTQFVGTVVQFDPATGTATRCLIQADPPASGKVGDPPPDKMWQALDAIELIDRDGNPVTGKAGQQLKAGDNGAADAPSKREASKSAAGASATR
jgi:hypothetical protein